MCDAGFLNANTIVALVALLIAGWSLYSTSLRRADIAMDLLSERSGPDGGGLSRAGPGMFPPDRLSLWLFVSNAGAHGGLLERLEVEHLECVSNGDRLWTGVAAQQLLSPVGGGVGLPLTMEAGDVLAGFLHVDLAGAPQYDLEEYAARLAEVRELRVRLVWSFGRSKPWAPWRQSGRRELITRRTEVSFDGEQFRELALELWRNDPAGVHERAIQALTAPHGPSA